ncbi:Enolase 4 [Channa argus]|uniref:phosphopyruvate hydratase n=1 Tax=Channa argus TaxID=215402 RepID=A0A6G1R0Y1_CHAAH|nr:Enolase 4 [Channa argus]
MSYQRFLGRLSAEEQDFYETKKAAAEFYRLNRIPEEIESALNQLFLQKPGDVHGYLSMSSAAIASLFGCKDTSLDWKTRSQERAAHVMIAVQWINEPLNNMLKGQNPCDQSEVDNILSTFFMSHNLEEKNICDGAKEESSSPGEPEVVLSSSLPAPTKDKKSSEKGKKSSAAEKTFPPPLLPEPVLPGSLAIGSVSLAVAKAGAQALGIPLYKYIATLKNQEATQVIVSDSGAPAVSYDRPEQPLDLITEACTNLGLALGAEIHIALNCAGSEIMDYSKGKYEVATGTLKSPDELVDMYQALIRKYPAVVAVIDPFRREDIDQWEKLSHLMGDSCSLLTDMTCKSKAPPVLGVRGYIVKHTDETTVSDLVSVTSEQQGSVLMGTTCNEPCLDDSVSDIAVGLGLDYVKLGGLSGAERMAKYNRLISIEEDLAQEGILATKEKHGPPLFAENLREQSSAAEGTLSDTA